MLTNTSQQRSVQRESFHVDHPVAGRSDTRATGYRPRDRLTLCQTCVIT
jgi:hypothetical protein